MAKRLPCLLMLACLVLPGRALAQENPDEQHSGVYLRMSVGVTSMQARYDAGTDSELGGSLSFALGYFILPELALSLDVFGANAYKFGVPDRPEETSVEFDARSLALGASLTYYLPYDFYLSVAPGVGWLLVGIAGQESRFSNAGFALDVIAGKEWWIGGSWALGAGLQLIYLLADVPSARVDYSWSLGVLFTVTRN